MAPLEVVILAAGQGTRMRSSRPKVLHSLAGRPLLSHVIGTARELAPARIHVVIGHGADAVQETLAAPDIVWSHQEQQLGTGHAVLQALPSVNPASRLLVLYGDVPLLRRQTLDAMAEAAGSQLALLAARVADPAGYGRVVRDPYGHFREVVEHRDASAEQRLIDEINTGVIAGPASLFQSYLPRVGNENAQGEYYLPDVLRFAVADARPVQVVVAGDEQEILGINDRVQLAVAEREYQRRIAHALMADGVALADPARLDVRGELRCGSDVFIDVGVVVEGSVELAEGVHIEANCILRNCSIGAGSRILAMSHVEGAVLGSGCSVGPFARLRPGTELHDGARVGNFVETKKSVIGRASKVNHLSYIGDSTLGSGVNIGAGTITCNYDGRDKHPTRIDDGAFVGSNSTLVAPVRVGPDGFVAAGSTVTRDIEAGELGVGRGRQRNIRGWQRPDRKAREET